MQRLARLSVPFVLCLACDSGTPPAADGAAPTETETKADAVATDSPATLRITGSVDLPGNQKLDFKAKLDKGETGYTGAMDIPLQGATGVPLTNVTVSKAELGFALANGATWKGTIGDDGAIACSFSQAGMTMTCSMSTVDEAAFSVAAPNRPQTPAPPFPYETKEIEWDAGQGVHLGGTVTTPTGAGPHPGVIFVSGSGQQDRDETLTGHKPFAVLADRLARGGIASLRYDDRGVGKSTGDLEKFTMEDEAADATSALDQLRKTDRIDPARIGFIGHSAGGVIAPLVASKRPDDVAFVVLIAGSGVTGKALHAKQAEALLTAGKVPQEKIDEAAKYNEAIYAVLASDKTEEERATSLKEILAKAGVAGPAADAQLAMVNSAWFRHFLEHDPAPVLEQTKCPVLVLSGDLDIQVLPDQNVPAIEAALKKGGNDDVTVRRFPGLNHLLQPAKTGMPDEYATTETTMDETAIAAIDTWVRAKAAL